MKAIIYSIFFLLFLTACTTAHLNYCDKKESFELTVNGEILTQQKVELLAENRVNLSHIKVYQYVYKLTNGKLIVYEEAYTHAHYSFTKSINFLVSKIFSSYHNKRIIRFKNLYFYELVSEKEKLYLLVENQNKKLLKLLYTTDIKVLQHFIVAVEKEFKFSTEEQKRSANICSTREYTKCIKSSWNYKNMLFVDLVKREGGKAKWLK